MFTKLASAIQRYVTENFNDLLKLDMHWARVLGAPAPFTLSAYAYKLEQEGKLGGKVFRPLIDKFFGEWIMNEQNHCKTDYEKIMSEVTPTAATVDTTPVASDTQPATEATNDTIPRPAQEDNGEQQQETSNS
jgi:hypothetical protein